MSGPTLTLRCPNCGNLLSAVAGPPPAARYVACPHCSAPVPVVPPRVPAPLFSWETYPHLYPTLPFPRTPDRRLRPITLAILFAAAALLLAASAVFLYGGWTVLVPHDYQLSGSVEGPVGPVAFARINVTGENGFATVVSSSASGSFVVGNVPTGAVTLNVSAATFSPTVFEMFVSSVYLALGAPSPTTLVVPMYYGDNSTTNLFTETAFPNLEALASSLWSGMVMWVFTAGIVLAAAWAFAKNGRFTRGVVAGATALASTAVPVLLGLTFVYPWILYVTLALGALGAAGLTLVLVPAAAVGRPPDFGPTD